MGCTQISQVELSSAYPLQVQQWLVAAFEIKSQCYNLKDQNRIHQSSDNFKERGNACKADDLKNNVLIAGK